MKNIIFKIIVSATVILLVTSCQKEANQSVPSQSVIKESIAKQSIEKQYAYVHENLKIIMSELGPVLKDKGFKAFINFEVAKMFDGSQNVLIKTILTSPIYGPKLNTDKMKKALDAFKGVNGENLYPQIYIPFFDKHQGSRSNNSARTSTAEETEFVIYDGDETISSVPSYVYDEEGTVIPTGNIVNEEYALNNEVYVISINESVNEDGDVSIVNSPNQTNSTVNFRIETMHVKDSKESWLAGDSEVHMKAVGSTWNHRQFGYPNSALIDHPVLRYASSSEYKGHEIKKVPRSDINSGVGSQYTVNYPLHTNWTVDNFYYDPIVYNYVIFEYDNWPAAVKTGASLSPSNPDPNTNKSF